MDPKVTIIIPCYNQGHFLMETLESVKSIPEDLAEVIIINDGSTDSYTNELCKKLEAENWKVMWQANKGLAAARNAAIKNARGKFILPLDSDNKIRQQYIQKGIDLLENNPPVAVVYGNALCFGEQTGIWEPGPFNLQKLMLANYIDACAVIRKSIIEEVGYYDESMRLGWEDWDLWLRIGFAGYDFFYLREVTFDYRITSNSMSKTLYSIYERPNSIENYIHQKYPASMGHNQIVDHYIRRFKKNPIFFLGKLFLRAYFPGYYYKLLKKNKIRNGL